MEHASWCHVHIDDDDRAIRMGNLTRVYGFFIIVITPRV